MSEITYYDVFARLEPIEGEFPWLVTIPDVDESFRVRWMNEVEPEARKRLPEGAKISLHIHIRTTEPPGKPKSWWPCGAKRIETRSK